MRIRKVRPMIEIRYVCTQDQAFWYSLDRHLPQQEFAKKVADQSGYVILEDDVPVGILRYNLFWDNTPFCTLLFIDGKHQKKGYGKKLMEHWAAEMKEKGFKILLTSTQADEQAQHFYRKLGYRDCGGLVLGAPGYEEPMELFFVKYI